MSYNIKDNNIFKLYSPITYSFSPQLQILYIKMLFAKWKWNFNINFN